MLEQPRVHISLDLLPNSEVIHISRGEEGCVTFEDSINLRDIDNLLGTKMHVLASTINISDYYSSNNLKQIFKDTLTEIGKNVYLKLLKGIVRDAFVTATHAPYDLSVSFKINKDFIPLPIEFMLDESGYPLAAKMPFYKTLTTSGYAFSGRNDLKPKQKLNILLVSSNTRVRVNDKIIMRNEEGYPHFTLPDVEEIDDKNNENEIDEIHKITELAKMKTEEKSKWGEINVKKMHTDEATYDEFMKELTSNEYNIIHYNGHGHSDLSENGKQNYMFFWKGEANKSPVVALDPETLGSSLKNAPHLQFVYLSCCEGASTEERPERYSNSFTGLLEAIVSAQVPNALGMRWPISVCNSKTFSTNFYRALLLDEDIYSVESALMKARSQALGYADYSVWASPILIKQSFH
jgi:hypothetical protein